MEASKSQESKQTERIAVDNIKPEQFDSLIDLLSRWISNGQVKLQIRPPSDITLIFDDSNITPELEKIFLPKNCIGQLKIDIPFMLAGILGGYRNIIIRFIAERVEVEKTKDKRKPNRTQIQEEIRARLQYLEEKIITLDLRQQYAIKQNAKTNIYLGTSWDIIEKHRTNMGSITPKAIHAVVQIALQKPLVMGNQGAGNYLPQLPEMFRESQLESLVLSMTIEDLQDLADNLNKAAQAIKQAMGNEKEV